MESPAFGAIISHSETANLPPKMNIPGTYTCTVHIMYTRIHTQIDLHVGACTYKYIHSMYNYFIRVHCVLYSAVLG